MTTTTRPPRVRYISGNELIGLMLDKPDLYLIRTVTRRGGPIWSTNTLKLVDGDACLRLIKRGALVERDPAAVPTGPTGAQSYDLSPEIRNRV
jgi:hypothetical protein